MKKRILFLGILIPFFISLAGNENKKKITRTSALPEVKSLTDSTINLESYYIIVNGKEIIVAKKDFNNLMNWFDAKKACERLGQGWRLPTNEELTAMYEQLYKKNLGNLYLQKENATDQPSEYWSLIENTPGDSEEAYFFCFANGLLQNTAHSNGRDKYEEYNVRAVKNLD